MPDLKDLFKQYCRADETVAAVKVPGIVRHTMTYGPDIMLCRFTEEKGAYLDVHTHEAAQIGYVLKGHLRFFKEDGSSVEMKTGDSYYFASMEPHGSEALEDTEIIECFTPARPEYVD